MQSRHLNTDSHEDAVVAHTSWIRERAGVANWRLDPATREVFDADGTIAICAREGDARFILAVCAAAEEPREADPPSPPIWCRDALADGTEPERLLRDGENRPIITLYAEHPRSAFNEDFILISRNTCLED